MANSLPEFDSILSDLCRACVHDRDAGNDVLACDRLIRDFLAHGHEQVVEQSTQSPGKNEYPLNGDGLKLQYDVEFYRNGDQTNVYVINLRIAGDQAERYPKFLRAAQRVLKAANGAGSAFVTSRLAG